MLNCVGWLPPDFNCVAELAFLYKQGLSIENAQFGIITIDAGLVPTRVLLTG